MARNSDLKTAREYIESFLSNKGAESSLVALEDGLELFNSIYESKGASCQDLEVIENVLMRLYREILNEADRVISIEPLASLKETEHWINVIRSLGLSGWPYTGRCLEAAKELSRLMKIIKQHKGHITRELRELYFGDLSWLKEFEDL